MTTTPPIVYCPACGREIPADAGFCRECGHHLATRSRPAAAEPEASSVPATTACPHCDAQVPVAAQFCGSCGKTVTVEEPPVEPATLLPSLVPEPPSAPEPTTPADADSTGRQLNGRVVAIAAAAVVLVGGGIAAALALSGDPSSPAAKAARAGTPPPSAVIGAATPEAPVATPTAEATVATPTPEVTVATPTPDSDTPAPSSDSALTAQVRTLDGLMQLSEQGRAAAVAGDTAAAAASRATLLRQLQSLRADATDARLQAAVDRFIAAIREALRQNRECGSACSAAELARVASLKRDALSKLNPLLREYVGRTYRLEEI
jgi:hypothetical protein